MVCASARFSAEATYWAERAASRLVGVGAGGSVTASLLQESLASRNKVPPAGHDHAPVKLFLLFLNDRSLLVVRRLLVDRGLLGLLVEIPHEYAAHPPVLDEFSLFGSWGGIIRQGEKPSGGGEFFPARRAAGSGG